MATRLPLLLPCTLSRTTLIPSSIRASINATSSLRLFFLATRSTSSARYLAPDNRLRAGYSATSPSSAPAAPHSRPLATATTTTSLPTRSLPDFDLTGRVVLVSGGARGLGLTCAEALLEAGASVYALDRLSSPDPDFDRIANRASSDLGTTLAYRQVDVRDNVGLNATVKEIADREGRVDGLIAAAGIQQETPALEYSQEDVEKMLSVNVTGVFMTSQAVARQMVRFGRPGSVVLIGSMSGTVANKGLICPAYNASKAAVLQLARNLASEWGQYGIRVNTISPGYIVTKMVEALFVEFPERKEEWPKQNMLGRLSGPEEYRGAAVFLISDASSFMTGSDLRIDGGHCAW